MRTAMTWSNDGIYTALMLLQMLVYQQTDDVHAAVAVTQIVARDALTLCIQCPEDHVQIAAAYIGDAIHTRVPDAVVDTLPRMIATLTDLCIKELTQPK
jgi:hypothetical protein